MARILVFAHSRCGPLADAMHSKMKEKGILKLDPRPRTESERIELSPQVSYERPPSSPQPSVDRLSVTWAEQPSMASSVNIFHLPSDAPINSDVKFSPTAAEGSEDEDYSASLSAVLRQRRASVRRSRKGRARRPSSPFLPDETRRDQTRRRSSVFTTSSGDTAISIEEGPVTSQEQIFENIHLHKEVLGSVKQQPLGMRRKLKLVNQAKTYIKRHEGQLQERLAQSKSTKDIYARFNIWMSTKWQQLKREASNTSNLLIPWELRIKEIESHFGSVVASYFTFLRWLFWVNLVIGFILLVFVIVPEYLTANPLQDGERKVIIEEERRNATNLLTVWEFEGVLKCSPIFYGYYSNIERLEYRMPLAYFLTGLVVYIYSFVAILRKMAENSRMSKLSEKEDECIFSWKLFTGWDFMIGNTETASNRMASIILSFKEALLEEAEKKKDLRNWRVITLRAVVNICVLILLAVSAYAVVYVVSRSDDNHKVRNWWRENETTIVVTVISITFPVFFELLGFLEHYHPRKQLRLQLARIMLLNLLNLYSLIFALFSKIEGMTKELDSLKPNVSASTMSENLFNINETFTVKIPQICVEEMVPCIPCNILFALAVNSAVDQIYPKKSSVIGNTNSTIATPSMAYTIADETTYLPENLIEFSNTIMSTTDNVLLNEIKRLRDISRLGSTTDNGDIDEVNDTSPYYDYTFDTTREDISSTEDTTFDMFNSSTTNLWDYSTVNNMATNESNEILSTFSTILAGSTESFDTSTESKENHTTISDGQQSTFFSTDPTDEFTSMSTISYVSTTYLSSEGTTSPIPTTVSKTITKKNIVLSPQINLTINKTLGVEKLITGELICHNITFNCTFKCRGRNITQIFAILHNCTIKKQACYVKTCRESVSNHLVKTNETNETAVDVMYLDGDRRMYNLTIATKKKLQKLCWETMFGQELIKLTMMDLVFVLLGTLFLDFLRALFVRYFNKCWCWDLEKKFPKYGDFKIAENILHLINNQGMVWMGMFFSPGLVVLNVIKLMIMMYLRSWAVMTCNVPHEVVFRVSKSNNFYLALLLTMLFLCVLPVGYTIVWVKPSWHCGPFSEYQKIYHILTTKFYRILPKTLTFALEYIASPAIVIPLLVLLILIIYYLTSLTNSLREANNDLKIQLRRERTEERRKMFQLADTRRRVGSSAMDNTPFARWKKALPSLPLSKSIDSDDRKTLPGEEGKESAKTSKKKGKIFAKIVSMALDKKSDVEVITEVQTPNSINNEGDETDTDFHETLPKELLKIKDITLPTKIEPKKRAGVEFKMLKSEKMSETIPHDETSNRSEAHSTIVGKDETKENTKFKPIIVEYSTKKSKLERNQTSESSTQSKQSDSISSVIPVITISTTESDDELLQLSKSKHLKNKQKAIDQEEATTSKQNSSELKSLRRQSSVDSVGDNKSTKEKKSEEGPRYQYSL